jgi:hypothetical protein
MPNHTPSTEHALRPWRRTAGNILMASLLLAFDPMRLSVTYAAVAQAAPTLTLECPLPGRVPSPTAIQPLNVFIDPCEPPTPGLSIYLNHGIGDDSQTQEDTESKKFVGSKVKPDSEAARTMLLNYAGFDGTLGALTSSGHAYAPWVNWKDRNITSQGQKLGEVIATNEGVNPQNRIALVGHSQGGLRSRAYLQLLKTDAFQKYQAKVDYLFTVDSPNSGAPIINNIQPAVTQVTTALSFALARPDVASVIAPIASIFGPVGVKSLLAGSGADDMAPQSQFMSNINAPDCRWESRTVRKSFLWWSWNETQYFQICSAALPAARAIPSNVNYLAIRGSNSNPDTYLGSTLGMETQDFVQLRQFLGTFFGAGGFAVGLGALFFPWLWVNTAAWFYLSYLMFDLPQWWKSQVVGTEESDAIVPFANQLLQKPGQVPVGGTPVGTGDAVFEKAQHGGNLSVIDSLEVSRLIQVTLLNRQR